MTCPHAETQYFGDGVYRCAECGDVVDRPKIAFAPAADSRDTAALPRFTQKDVTLVERLHGDYNGKSEEVGLETARAWHRQVQSLADRLRLVAQEGSMSRSVFYCRCGARLEGASERFAHRCEKPRSYDCDRCGKAGATVERVQSGSHWYFHPECESRASVPEDHK